MSPHSTAALIMCASVWGSKDLMKEKAMRERGCKQERLISCWKSSPASRTRALERAITAREAVLIHNGPKTLNN